MNNLLQNESMFHGLNLSSLLSPPGLSPFAKSVFFIKGTVKVVTKWILCDQMTAYLVILIAFPFLVILADQLLFTEVVFSDPSIIKLNYYSVSLLYVHARLCMLCTHAYSDQQSFCILMCHKVIQITMPSLLEIG